MKKCENWSQNCHTLPDEQARVCAKNKGVACPNLETWQHYRDSPWGDMDICPHGNIREHGSTEKVCTFCDNRTTTMYKQLKDAVEKLFMEGVHISFIQLNEQEYLTLFTELLQMCPPKTGEDGEEVPQHLETFHGIQVHRSSDPAPATIYVDVDGTIERRTIEGFS